jgi:hypothetical protein
VKREMQLKNKPLNDVKVTGKFSEKTRFASRKRIESVNTTAGMVPGLRDPTLDTSLNHGTRSFGPILIVQTKDGGNKD